MAYSTVMQGVLNDYAVQAGEKKSIEYY
jgi:hypothetical protein